MKLRILCLGNPLHSNDALGEAVFSALQKVELPVGVEIVDGGIGGMTLTPYFRDCQRVLIVDLVKTSDPIGSHFLIENLPSHLADYPAPSAEHGGNLATLMTMLPIYLNAVPHIDLIGMTATQVSYFDQHIDPAIEQGIGKLCARIQTYVEDHLSA